MVTFDVNYVLMPDSESDDEVRKEAFLEELHEDIIKWLQYCWIVKLAIRNYYREQRRCIRRFPFTINGHMFMLDAMQCSPQQCYVEISNVSINATNVSYIFFAMSMGCALGNTDIYEHVGMFICILARGKGYRQVQTLFNHSLETIGHYFKIVLQAVVECSARLIQPDPNYNHDAEHHIPNSNEHPLFENCICAIDGTHLRVVLPRNERVNFIGCKGIRMQNVLVAYDFNLCFTIVLAGTTGNTHDARCCRGGASGRTLRNRS